MRSLKLRKRGLTRERESGRIDLYLIYLLFQCQPFPAQL